MLTVSRIKLILKRSELNKLKIKFQQTLSKKIISGVRMYENLFNKIDKDMLSIFIERMKKSNLSKLFYFCSNGFECELKLLFQFRSDVDSSVSLS